jgi:hypothetical protein
MINRMFPFLALFLVSTLLSGCAAAGCIPFIGGSQAIPVAGGSYQGYTVWKGRESSRYYKYDVKIVCQAVKQSCEQLKLETVIQNPASENGCSLETKGKYPMEINVSYVEKHLTKVVITIDLFGDKQYAELLYRTIDDIIPKKMDNIPTRTDNIHETTTSDK